MTALREWFFHQRFATSIAKTAKTLGVTPSYLSRVVGGDKRPSIQLARALEELTGGTIKWHDIMQYVDQPKSDVKKIDLNITNI